MSIERRKPNYESIRLSHQKLVTDGKATVDLPRRTLHIFEGETWKHFTKSTGEPFESFIDYMKAPQPYGAGLGQARGSISAPQLWQLCSGMGKIREALLPLAAEQIKPVAGHGTNQHSKTGHYNVISSQGNSAEYLLGKMARDAAKHPNGKAAKALARIESGEITSVRQAAIECGIIKAKDSKPKTNSEKVTLPKSLVERIVSQMEAAFDSVRFDDSDEWPVLEELKKELGQ